MSIGTAPLSPNQLAKRRAIVDAAVRVLLRDGVAACTVRAIADEASISKSVIHYYFADVDEIVDRAMYAAVGAWLVLLEGELSPATHHGGADRYWRAVDASLQPFAQGDQTLMPLWLEYWTQCIRRNRLDPLQETLDLLVAWVASLLADTGTDRPQQRAEAVTAFLFGLGMHQPAQPIDHELIDAGVTALGGVPRPG